MADIQKQISNAISLAETIYEDLDTWGDPETAKYSTRDLVIYLKEIKETLHG